MWRDGEMYHGTLVSTFSAESERGGGRERPHGPPRSWIIDEVGGMEAFHRLSPILPPQPTHTHTLNLTQTIFLARTKSLRSSTHSRCSSSPALPNIHVHLKPWFYLDIHTVSHSHTHTFWGPHHACIIETHLARWLSPDIWLTKPVTHKPREYELNSPILLQKKESREEYTLIFWC